MGIQLTNELSNMQEKLKELKLNKKELNENQDYLLKNGIVGYSCEDIHVKTEEVYKILVDTPVREDGGRNALFGFYYQFLVAIDYLIELIEGKWSFMSLEIHDDIVLCKEEEDEATVRFVQVKTSKHASLAYLSTELCTRTEKGFQQEERKVKRRVNNSWLDKLFSNAEIFKGKDAIKQQFQLVTNFTFYVPKSAKDSETKDINHYRLNKTFSGIEINEDDPFYKKLNVDLVDSDGIDYHYYERTGKSIQDLLSNTQIWERVDHLSNFRDGICKRLGKMLSNQIKVEGGATVLDEDINWLIGEMCASCAAREDKLVLFIGKEKAMYLASKLFERATKYSEDFRHAVGNKKLIDDALYKIILELRSSHPEIIEEFEEIVIKTKSALYRWVDEGGSILQLVSRFHEGREETLDFHARMHKSQREDSVHALALIFTLLSVINNNTSISSKYKSILIKEIMTSIGESYDFAFIKIDDYYYEDVLEKLKEIITRLHIQSHGDLLLMTNGGPHRMVIHGSPDSLETQRFLESKVEVVTLNKPHISEFGENHESMNEVNYKFLLIPWHVIESKYMRFKKKRENFEEFNEKLQEIWKTLSRVGDN